MFSGQAGAAANSDTLSANQTLGAGQQLISGDRQYTLVMQTDGNLVEYYQGRFVWKTNTGGGSGARAVMQGDGNFVVYAGNGQPSFATNTGGTAANSLVVQNDGNVVLYGAGRAFWSSNTMSDRLNRGETLQHSQQLRSQGGQYVLRMQDDGNLVTYGPNGAVWDSKTTGTPSPRAILQNDGNFVVYGSDGSAPFATSTGSTSGDTLIVQNDGNVVLYGAGKALWASRGGLVGVAAGDDYPTKWRNVPQDSVFDSWGEYNRECTSFSAWRLSSRNHFTMPFHDNAVNWKSRAQALGYAVNSTPARGAIAWRPGGNHVAWVSSVSGPNVTIEQYNANFNGTYSSATVAASTFQYIHFSDF